MNDHTRFLPQATSILKEEKGVVIITALMILVLLTIVGIASTTISNTETKIATNEAIYLQSLYNAEGAAQEVFARMKSTGFHPEDTSNNWIWKDLNTYEADMAYDHTFWDGTMTEAKATPDSSILSDAELIVIIDKIDIEAEVGVPVRYYFTILGRCEPPRGGSATVEIGYIEKF
jgi:Tfp pilus assembly protein PilX